MLTQQQKLDRNKGIGGSDAAIIMGLSKYKTSYQLFLEKKGLLENQFEETPVQYWGNRLEAIIRDEFALRNGVVIETPDAIVHPFHDHLRANIDGYIPEWDAVLEVKCSSSFMAHEWGESGSDKIPLAYLTQVAHYVSVMNARCAHIAVLIGGNDYREFKYERDLELEGMVIRAATDFWNAVQNDNAPPAFDDSDLKLMYPVAEAGKKIMICNTASQQLTNLTDARAKIKALEAKEKEATFNIKEIMKDAEALVDIDNKPLVTWKTNKRGRTFLVKGDKSE